MSAHDAVATSRPVREFLDTPAPAQAIRRVAQAALRQGMTTRAPMAEMAGSIAIEAPGS